MLLLVMAQDAAVVHELSHLSGLDSVDVRIDSGSVADAGCALCPVFAQVVAPAFSHSFHVPDLVRADLERSPEPRHAAIESAVPTPRSRGPPSLS
jgi:hypothetical protein